MRKTICTASIFAAMVGILVAGMVIEVTDTLWWGSSISYPGYKITVLLWFNNNVLVPLAIVALCCGALFGLWHASSTICAKLRGGAQ